MTKWPTIPDPGTTLESLVEPVKVMKSLLQMITGQQGGSPAPVPCVYRSLIAPGAVNSPIPKIQLKDSDIWINLASSAKLNYWDGDLKIWVPTT